MHATLAMIKCRGVNKLPNFPDNTLGIRRGSHIYSDNEELAATYEFMVGQPFPICFDGAKIYCGNMAWEVAYFFKAVTDGLLKISDTEPVSETDLLQLEYQTGGQIEIEYLFSSLWGTPKVVPDVFCIVCASDVRSADIKTAALKHEKAVTIMAEAQPMQLKEGGTSGAMTVVAGDSGLMSLGLVQCLPQILANALPMMLSGDKLFIFQLTN